MIQREFKSTKITYDVCTVYMCWSEFPETMKALIKLYPAKRRGLGLDSILLYILIYTYIGYFCEIYATKRIF